MVTGAAKLNENKAGLQRQRLMAWPATKSDELRGTLWRSTDMSTATECGGVSTPCGAAGPPPKTVRRLRNGAAT